MLLGATGSGKSTLLDAMVNYIAGVSLVDDHRFQLVHLTEEEEAKSGKQVTFSLNIFYIYFNLNICVNATLITAFNRYVRRNARKRIPKGGQALRSDHEKSDIGS